MYVFSLQYLGIACGACNNSDNIVVLNLIDKFFSALSYSNLRLEQIENTWAGFFVSVNIHNQC